MLAPDNHGPYGHYLYSKLYLHVVDQGPSLSARPSPGPRLACPSSPLWFRRSLLTILYGPPPRTYTRDDDDTQYIDFVLRLCALPAPGRSHRLPFPHPPRHCLVLSRLPRPSLHQDSSHRRPHCPRRRHHHRPPERHLRRRQRHHRHHHHHHHHR